MPRLPRPAISLEVKCRVVLRQLGEMWVDLVIEAHRADRSVSPKFRTSHGKLLADRLPKLATLLGCELKDLRLDHDPALGAREKVYRWRTLKHGLGREYIHVDYKPPANDPEYLAYRPHGPQFERSHLVKTNVRGDHGQYPDRVLIKRQRQREQGPKPKRKWGRPHLARTKPKPGSRPLKSANRWPPKGSQKIRRRTR